MIGEGRRDHDKRPSWNSDTVWKGQPVRVSGKEQGSRRKGGLPGKAWLLVINPWSCFLCHFHFVLYTRLSTPWGGMHLDCLPKMLPSRGICTQKAGLKGKCLMHTQTLVYGNLFKIFLSLCMRETRKQKRTNTKTTTTLANCQEENKQEGVHWCLSS